jgi:hypothetical protein
MTDTPPREPSRRLRDMGSILPVAGLALLMPPLVGLLAGSGGSIFGMPPLLAYLFGVWLALIAGALIVSWRLRDAVGPD